MARSRNPGPNRTQRRVALAALRREGRGATSRARRLERQIVRQQAEIARAGRIFNRRYVAQLREELRDFERQQRAEERAAKRTQTALRHFLTTPSKQTTYQRRVVSRITRQVERGEAPSISSRANRLAIRIEQHARKLDIKYGSRQPGPGPHVENPGDFFRSLPREQQILVIDEDARREQIYIEGGRKPLGLPFNPLFAYHS
jgi:hypothetical protein